MMKHAEIKPQCEPIAESIREAISDLENITVQQVDRHLKENGYFFTEAEIATVIIHNNGKKK